MVARLSLGFPPGLVARLHPAPCPTNVAGNLKKTKLESKSKNFSPTPSKDKVYDTDFDMIMTGF